MNLPEHALNDAFVLRNRSVPDDKRDEIIARHANHIERTARQQRDIQIWRDGQLPPKALFVASYVNEMFMAAHRGRNVLSQLDVANLYDMHVCLVRKGELMSTNPLGFTALSALSFAADKVRGEANPQGLLGYICQPIGDDAAII